MSGTMQNQSLTATDIDPSRPIPFTFNGKVYQGYHGDTLASALLRNGVHFVARSWKYHRPRGIMAAGVEESNALVQAGQGRYATPNARMTEIELVPGLVASSVNATPSLNRDPLAVAQLFSPFIAAGFYYKTFMWPKRFWPFYERRIRQAAGLGRVPTEADADQYDMSYAHCDVLVIGAGPAGLQACVTAADAGARVICVETDSRVGGALLRRDADVDGQSGSDWARQTAHALDQRPDVTLLTRSTAYAYMDHNLVVVAQRLTDHLYPDQRHGPRMRTIRVRAKAVVLATGAHERPLVFENNDRPGVMLASAVSTYIRRFGVVPGSRAVVFTNNDEAYLTALDLLARDVPVTVIDARPQETDCPLVQAVRDAGGVVKQGMVVTRVAGLRRVRSVRIATYMNGRAGDTVMTLPCNLLAVSGGWNPVIQLFAQAGGKLDWDETRACFVPGAPAQSVLCAGAVTGADRLEAILHSGKVAAVAALKLANVQGKAKNPGQGHAVPLVDQGTPIVSPEVLPLWLVDPARRLASNQFVDYQNDVTASDIRMALNEGYRSIEHVKRYTALGFGTDQGKLGNVNAAGLVAQLRQKLVSDVGMTTFRPNYIPVPFGAIAGHRVRQGFAPVRRTPLYDWHEKQGANFENVATWRLPWSYPSRAALTAPLMMVDASALGKLDIQGADTLAFLEHLTGERGRLSPQTAAFLTLTLDNARTVRACCARLTDNQFRIYCAIPDSELLLEQLEYRIQSSRRWQSVYVTDMTDQSAAFVMTGQQARQAVASVMTPPDDGWCDDLSRTMMRTTLAGVPVRLLSVPVDANRQPGDTQTLVVMVSASRAQRVWDTLVAINGVSVQGIAALRDADRGMNIVTSGFGGPSA